MMVILHVWTFQGRKLRVIIVIITVIFVIIIIIVIITTVIIITIIIVIIFTIAVSHGALTSLRELGGLVLWIHDGRSSSWHVLSLLELCWALLWPAVCCRHCCRVVEVVFCCVVYVCVCMCMCMCVYVYVHVSPLGPLQALLQGC